MTPHEYLHRFRPERALLMGDAFEQGPLTIQRGDVVGVVLMGLGGPSRTEEVVPFLHSRLMDPAEVDFRTPRVVRKYLVRLLARRHGRDLTKAFELIGGSSPLRRHAVEQARALERRLNARLGPVTGAEFRTYVAMRHGDPSMAAACTQMDADEVTKTVLLPLEPHFSAATTGSSLSYWQALQTGADEARQTTLIAEYATHPKLVHAINERIDEGLQRFPREVRDGVQILFVAHGVPKRHLVQYDDPYCCQIEATVRAVLAERQEPGRLATSAFLDPVGNGRTHGLSVADAIDDLASDGSTSLLVVPVSFISDRIETAFDLDVTARARATEGGVLHFEVTSGLNCHPLLVEALAESVAWHVVPEAVASSGGEVVAAPPSAPPAQPALRRAPARCPVCERTVETRTWEPGLPAYAARPSGGNSREAA